MRYLIPTSDHPYYLWQVLVQAQAFRELGEHGVWIIYYDQTPSPLLQAILDAGIGEIHTIADWPRDRTYNSAMKEWLVAKYLADHPEPGPVALYDPDAIPTRTLELIPEPGILHGTDTDSYTGPAYLREKGAWEGLCELIGVAPELAEKYPGVGAQYVWQGMPASVWEEIAQLSIQAFNWLKTVPAPEGSNAVQAWCADMFVTQLVAIREGWQPRIAPELSMVWANGPSSGWDTAGVFHDAGIPEPTPGHFCKLAYQRSPFFQPIEDVDPTSASARYVDLIRATERTWPELCRAFDGSDSQTNGGGNPIVETELDYVRRPIPDAALCRPDGSEIALDELAQERAAFLLLVPATAPARDMSLSLFPHWRARLSNLNAFPVLREYLHGTPPPDHILLDPGAHVSDLFGASDATAAAVLLGADGMLAGGPVTGTDAIAQFVADIAAALEDSDGTPVVDQTEMTDGPHEDLQVAIPDTGLVDADGTTISLARLTERRAALLVFPGPSGEQRDATLRGIAGWPGRMPLVDFVIVVRDLDAERDELAPHSDHVLGDPYGTVEARFGASGLSAAVLLGTDGLLAGGPVLGAEAIIELVRAMSHERQATFVGTLRPAIPISCKCITYGRVEYLEESLESFLRQEYNGDHELVIVNDYPLQRLHFDHPRVRIYNLDFTFESIGEKENFAVSACSHDTIAVWDDDDLALPHHLRNINRYYPGNDLLHWERGVFFNQGRIAALAGLGNSGIVYNKPLWRAVGGHPMENAGYDASFVNRLRGHGARVTSAAPPPQEASWFYSWGNGSYHMSGMGTDHDQRPNVVLRHSAHIEALRQAGLIPTGEIELKPHWNQDYSALLSEYCLGYDG